MMQGHIGPSGLRITRASEYSLPGTFAPGTARLRVAQLRVDILPTPARARQTKLWLLSRVRYKRRKSSLPEAARAVERHF